MIEGLTIHDKLLASEIKRWHMVSVTRQQTVAEHSFNVAIIVGYIADALELPTDERDRLVIDAMLHDIDEVRTGDISPPAKEFMRAQGFEPNNMVNRTPDELGRLGKFIIGFADVLESLVFIRQYGVGEHARQVMRGIETKYAALLVAMGDAGLSKQATAMRNIADKVMKPDYKIWDSGHGS